HYDFSATDSGPGEVLSYQLDHKSEGAVFDESTGAFSWQPDQAGTYSFVVSATDGTTVTAKSVIVTVTHDRRSAVEAVIAPYDQEKSYISSSLRAYRTVYEDVMNALDTVSDERFYQKLIEMNAAVESLEELTPLMQDGSSNYVDLGGTSTFGNQIINVVDGASDSVAGAYLADNLSY
ncbi:hypothetical protein BZG24_30805, partial [Escherichia coli]|uniref:Ig domain-containing protein n=1 Tax=Escherichia coli TaxID=562 RepID=UPI0022AE74E4